jgi:hypothetical protein
MADLTRFATHGGAVPGLRAGVAVLALLLAACGGGTNDATTVSGNVPVAYVKRVNTLQLNPLSGAPSLPGGDLMIRELASPSAPEHNITAPFTQGVGDASDPEVSYDGKKIVFSMNCPATNTATVSTPTGTVPACTGHWNIWEYDMSVGGITAGTFRRLTSSTTADDVGPVYLPAGAGFVFSSNRQAKAYPNQALGHSYYALDEYEREQVFNLHTMDNNGNNVQQISFNQSHDRNPVVRTDGSIMFSRWEHVADRNRFSIFTVKPDGTNMFIFYGAHADGNSFLHPRDMDPNGKYAGFIVSDLMPLSRTQAGGALMLIDAANYSDQNTPANSTVPTQGGQVQVTAQALNYNTGLSPYGRVTTPYPLWDGTDRILVSYAPCEVTNAGVVVSCATLSQAEIAALSDPNRLLTQAQADPVQANVPASYAIYTFDPANQTWLLVAAPPAGYMYTDPIPLQARTEPSVSTPTSVDTTLLPDKATIEVRSVYDTDLLGRMGTQMLTAADLPSGCTTGIPQTAPLDPQDTRPSVADLVALKDPANPAFNCTPVRFVRAVRAVAPPSGSTGLRQAIGATNFEQSQIVGYAPVEPDGSFKLNIPADTPIGLSVLDAQGRAFQVHTNWIQARPGEHRTCDGCHSPRRGAAINSGTVANSIPAAWLQTMASAHQPGETMASTHTRIDPTQLAMTTDLVYNDAWTNPAKATPRASIALRYTGNANSADDLVTPVPTQGIINYPDHVQPLWTRSRGTGGANTCINCHTDPATLDLSSTIAGSGRMASYDSLMIGSPVIDPTTGQPVLQVQDGVQVVEMGPALVYVTASESQAVGMARQSRLIEILSGQTLMSSAAARTAFPTPTTPNHAGMLNAAEMRLLAEWIDLGGKYYNDPFAAGSGVLVSTALTVQSFQAQVYPILLSTCATGCHMPRGSNQTAPAGTSFVDNKFVLTGNPQGDFNNTLTMITDTCNPANNYLLSKPSTVPHPAGATGQTTAVLPVGSANYTTIANWIKSGCP